MSDYGTFQHSFGEERLGVVPSFEGRTDGLETREVGDARLEITGDGYGFTYIYCRECGCFDINGSDKKPLHSAGCNVGERESAVGTKFLTHK